MRETSILYQAIKDEIGSYYEVEVINGDHVYTAQDLKTIKITTRMLKDDGLSIGNACASECKLTLIESTENWARMSEFSVRVRLMSEDGYTRSEWIRMGTFFTDERKEDMYGNLSIIGYDRMLKMEINWLEVVPEEDVPASWPVTAREMVSILADAVDFEVENINNIDNRFAFIGLDTTRMVRDQMMLAATGCGGSWIVTLDDKLRFVPFLNGSYGVGFYAVADFAIVGNAIVGTSASGVEGFDFIGIEDIGLSAEKLVTSPSFLPIEGVEFTSDTGVKDAVGNDSAYVLRQQCNYSRNGAAELAFSRLHGYCFRPFELEGALIDPATEIGDMLIVDDSMYQITMIEWNISPHITADVSAPPDDEVDHEYPYLTKTDRTYNKVQTLQNDYEEAYSEIVQEVGEINIEVGKKVGSDEIISKINLSPEAIVIQANRIDMTGTVTFTDLDTPGQASITGSNIKGGTLTLGGEDNISGLLIVNDYYGAPATKIDYLGIYTNSLNATGSVHIDAPYHGSIVMPGLGWDDSTIEMSSNAGFMCRTKNKVTGYPEFYVIHQIRSSSYFIEEENASSYWVWEQDGIDGYYAGDTTLPMTIHVGVQDNSNSSSMYPGGVYTTGTKRRVLNDDQYGQISFYCYETPAPTFGDIGEGQLDENGICVIEPDPLFDYSTTLKGYQVFLQKYGQGDCWVSERATGYFVVEGTPGLAFGWEIKARQSGYDQVRYDDPNALDLQSESGFLKSVYSYMDDLIERSIAA